MTRAPRRLAIFLPAADGGGAERNMLRLARHLVASGEEVDLVFGRAAGPFLHEVPEGCRVVDLSASRVALALPGLVQYLRASRPRALVSALDHANIIALIAARVAGTDTPVVVSVRSTMSAHLARSANWKERLFLAPLMRRWYPSAAAVVAVSEGTAADLRQILQSRANVTVIGNPVVTAALADLAGAAVTHPWFVDGAEPVIVAAGRLTDQKGFDTLIEAFARLRTRVSARLWIAGQGVLAEELRAQVRRLGLEGEVELAGFVPNPFPYIRRSRVFALSSRFEGLPTVLIEAMALGTRVVATDCPSGPAEILDGGRWGRLVPVDDAPALAAALEEAITAPEWPMPGADALEPWTPQVILRRWDAVLAEAGAHAV